MKTGAGSMRWVKALENTNGNKAGTIIPDVLFTKALSSGLKVYVAGTIKDATISTSSGSFSGGPDGDGYILRFGDSTTDVEIYPRYMQSQMMVRLPPIVAMESLRKLSRLLKTQMVFAHRNQCTFS